MNNHKHINKTARLTQMEATEVSIVDKGANKKKYIMVKKDSKDATAFEHLKKAQDGDQDAIKEILKALFEKMSDETLKEIGLQKINAATPPETEVPEDEIAKAVALAIKPFMEKQEASLGALEKKVNTVSDFVDVSQARQDPDESENDDDEGEVSSSNLGGKSLRE